MDFVSDTCVHVRNLPPTVLCNDVYSQFSKYGNIAQVTVPSEAGTRKTKGYAFIQYHQSEHAKLAISSLHRQELWGRTLSVQFSRSHPKLKCRYNGALRVPLIAASVPRSPKSSSRYSRSSSRYSSDYSRSRSGSRSSGRSSRSVSCTCSCNSRYRRSISSHRSRSYSRSSRSRSRSKSNYSHRSKSATGRRSSLSDHVSTDDEADKESNDALQPLYIEEIPDSAVIEANLVHSDHSSNDSSDHSELAARATRKSKSSNRVKNGAHHSKRKRRHRRRHRRERRRKSSS